MTPHRRSLFAAFMTISLSAFGGALPWARQVLVERRGWLKPDEFTEMLALSQFLPGPNIVNCAIMVGARFRGPAGAVAALLGLIVPAFCIVVVLGALYARYGDLSLLRGPFAGVTAAAAGLVVAMAVKMATPLVRSRAPASLPVAAAAFVAVGLLNWPLPWVLLGLAPVSVAAAWWCRR